MELELQKRNVSYRELVVEVALEQEETLEMIVPDLSPDILRIVDTSGIVTIKSREIQESRISISGTVKTSVIYVPDGDNGVKRLEISLPFSRILDNEHINNSSRPLIKAEVASIETRVINPRKILVRAGIMFFVRLYNQAELELGHNILNQNEFGVQLLKKGYTNYTNIDVVEKSFAVNDELELSSSKPPILEILKTDISLVSQDTKLIGNKVVFKGMAVIKSLYLADGGDLCLAEHELPFSQIAETEGGHDDADCTVDMYIESFEVDNLAESMAGGRAISVSIAITAQVCVAKELEITLINDMYSTMYNMETDVKQFNLTNIAGNISKRQSMREIVETGMQVTSVVDVYVQMSQVSLKIENDKLNMSSEASVTAIYVGEDGGLYSCERQLSVPCQMDIPAESACKATAVCPGEIFASPSSGGIEVRFPVDFAVTASKTRHIAAVSGFKADFSATKDLSGYPSVVLRIVDTGEEMWDIAKRYNTTSDEIMTANSIEEGVIPAIGQMLLIPKKR